MVEDADLFEMLAPRAPWPSDEVSLVPGLPALLSNPSLNFSGSTVAGAPQFMRGELALHLWSAKQCILVLLVWVLFGRPTTTRHRVVLRTDRVLLF